MQTEATGLTAAFEDMPTNHDGTNPFTFRIAFSAEVEITPEDMRDHALVVSGGTVTAAAQVDGRKDLWELTVEPAGSGPVSILTPLERACTEAGALCTAAGVMLTVAPALQVAGPAAQGQQALAPLTVGFVSVPAEHDGETEFWLELTFDAAVAQGSKSRIQALLGTTGGSVTRIRRKDGRLDHWRIRIEPSSHEAVTVTLSPSPPCGAAGAVCTEDGRTYTTALATQIQGPPGLTVADAEVEEGPNAVLSFSVTLSRAPSSTVTVDGVDPFLWTPSDCAEEVFRCRKLIHPTRRNTGSRWLSWFARAVRPGSWPGSSSVPLRRFATGCARPTATRAVVRTV